MKEDEQMTFRSRRSIDEDDEDVRTDTNLLSEVNQLIVRREIGNKDKKYQKKDNGVPVIKSKDKKVNNRHDQNAKRKDSVRLSKKPGLEIQADKHGHHAKADKRKTKANEFSKANLVKALIGADSGAKRNAGVPDNAYRELAEFIASSEQPTIETSSKKSDIARPVAQGSHKKLTKKHKRVLEILSKMAPNLLRKYFHRKGLDKYWKVMDNIRKRKQKQSEKEKLKAHKDVKSAKHVKLVAPKKPKSSSGITHPEKDAKLKKQAKSHKKNFKKEVSQHKIVKNTASKKSNKREDLKSSSKQKVIIVKPAKETHNKKQSQKTTVEQHQKDIPQAHMDDKKNLFKAVRSKDVVKIKPEESKIASGKSPQVPNAAASHAKDSVASQTHEKPKSPEVKSVNDKSKDGNDSVVQVTKSVKVNASHVKVPVGSFQSAKVVKPIQVADNKDSSTKQLKTSQPRLQEQKIEPHHRITALAISAPIKMTNKSSAKVADENPEKIPKAHTDTVHHVIKTAHVQQAEVKQDKKQDESYRKAKQENPASGKIDYLKEKIRKTNNLKFKVARALLAHCETQNRLRQVFDDVNSSLKKAASLAKAIGSKFGIKQSDIEKMTSEHTEDAVEQFLNKLF